jgi:hypothetical protein
MWGRIVLLSSVRYMVWPKKQLSMKHAIQAVHSALWFTQHHKKYKVIALSEKLRHPLLRFARWQAAQHCQLLQRAMSQGPHVPVHCTEVNITSLLRLFRKPAERCFPLVCRIVSNVTNQLVTAIQSSMIWSTQKKLTSKCCHETRPYISKGVTVRILVCGWPCIVIQCG